MSIRVYMIEYMCLSNVSGLAIHTVDVHDVLGIIVSTIVRVLLDQT